MPNPNKQVEVTIGADGTIKFNYIGFPGQKCLEEAEVMQSKLAASGVLVEIIEMIPKPEMLLVEVENTQGQRQGQGQTGQA